jgi:hypothetical protein
LEERSFSARAAAWGLTVLAHETRRDGVHSRWARLMALSEIPQCCSPKFPR